MYVTVGKKMYTSMYSRHNKAIEQHLNLLFITCTTVGQDCISWHLVKHFAVNYQLETDQGELTAT